MLHWWRRLWWSLIMTIRIIFTTMMVLSQESSMSHFLRRQIEPREETQPYHPNLPSSKNYFPTLIEVKFPFVCAKIVLYIFLNGCWSVKFSGKCWSFFPICARKLFLRILRNSRCSSSCNSLRGITHICWAAHSISILISYLYTGIRLMFHHWKAF